jgi:APOBEC-like N-terminal domain
MLNDWKYQGGSGGYFLPPSSGQLEWGHGGVVDYGGWDPATVWCLVRFNADPELVAEFVSEPGHGHVAPKHAEQLLFEVFEDLISLVKSGFGQDVHGVEICTRYSPCLSGAYTVGSQGYRGCADILSDLAVTFRAAPLRITYWNVLYMEPYLGDSAQLRAAAFATMHNAGITVTRLG